MTRVYVDNHQACIDEWAWSNCDGREEYVETYGKHEQHGSLQALAFCNASVPAAVYNTSKGLNVFNTIKEEHVKNLLDDLGDVVRGLE